MATIETIFEANKTGLVVQVSVFNAIFSEASVRKMFRQIFDDWTS